VFLLVFKYVRYVGSHISYCEATEKTKGRRESGFLFKGIDVASQIRQARNKQFAKNLPF